MRIRDTSVPIVVFMCDRDVFNTGALAVARSAGRLGIPVHGVHDDAWTPGALSRYNRNRLVCNRELSEEEWVDGLTRLGRRLGSAVLVPMDDTGALLVNEHADVLSERFLFPRQPPGLVRSIASKSAIVDACDRLGVPVPRSDVPASRDDLERYADGAEYPIVLKRIEPWERPTGDAPSVSIARDHDELTRLFERMRSPDGTNVMLQEYIAGGTESCWMLNGYFDERSECLVSFTGRKIRQRGPSTGATTLGLCEPNETVHEMTVRLMKGLGYRGILDIDYRYDERDGSYKLLDLNPRIGSTFRLFVDAGGIDVLRALYLDMTGQPVPTAAPRNRRRWVDESSDLVASLQLGSAGELGLGSWARSFHGLEEAAWFARDDFVPGVVMSLRFLGGVAGRRIRGLGGDRGLGGRRVGGGRG